MPDKTNWESAETWQRVIASILATGITVRRSPSNFPTPN